MGSILPWPSAELVWAPDSVALSQPQRQGKSLSRESWAPAGSCLDLGASLGSPTHRDPGVASPAEGEAHLEPQADTAGGPSRRAVEVILCAWHQGCRVQLCRVPADRQGRQVWLYWGGRGACLHDPQNSSACHQGALSTTSETPWGVHGEHCLPGPLAHHPTVTHLLFHLPGTAPTPLPPL